ncbi:MAG: hypothetical protein HYZ57_12970 [Acidobacteria bacterium]|nr:hypothetical protein [Acidobacteriota bacterium]MBI3280742.1 hypothetical protein [Acidobacteriota bacterium]
METTGNGTLQVTIQSVCNANPQSAQLGGQTGKTQIQWQATAGNSYTLKLPGGVFSGQPNAFEVSISGTGWQPSTALSLDSNATAQTIGNYIYQNNANCPSLAGDPPPEIVIES